MISFEQLLSNEPDLIDALVLSMATPSRDDSTGGRNEPQALADNMAPLALDFDIGGGIPDDIIVNVTATDIVAEFGSDADSDLDATSLSFGAVTANGNQALTLADVGFTYTPGTNDAGSFTIDTNVAAFIDGLADGETAEISIKFTLSDGENIDSGVLTFTVIGTAGDYDLDITYLGANIVGQSLEIEASAGAGEAQAAVVFTGPNMLRDIVDDIDISSSINDFVVSFGGDSLTGAYAYAENSSTASAIVNTVAESFDGVNGGVAIAIDGSDAMVTADNSSMASARAENFGFAAASATGGSTATSAAADGIDASKKSSARASADKDSTSTAVASGNSAAIATARDSSDSLALAEDNSRAAAVAVNESSTTAVANEYSNASAAAHISSTTSATADKASWAQATAANSSVANAEALMNSISTSVASLDSAASASTLDESDALVYAEDQSAAEATAKGTSSASSSAIDSSNATASGFDNSRAISDATGSASATSYADDASDATASGFGDSVATSVATDSASATSYANDASDALAAAFSNSTADADARTKSSANAVSLNDSAVNSTAENSATALSLSDDGSEATSSAEGISTAIALANDKGVADAMASNNSAARAATGSGTATATASSVNATADAVALTGGTAIAAAFDNSQSTAFATDSSTADATATATAAARAFASAAGDPGDNPPPNPLDANFTQVLINEITALAATGKTEAADIAQSVINAAIPTEILFIDSFLPAILVADPDAVGGSSAAATATDKSTANSSASDGGAALADSLSFSGDEDVTRIIPIDVSSVDLVSSVESVTVSGLPGGSTLSAGTPNGNGSVWTINGPLPGALTLTTPMHYNGTIELLIESRIDDQVASRVMSQFYITPVNDAPTGNVIIQGAPLQGQTLTASNTLADVDGLGVIAYQWIVNGIPVEGANSNSYVITVDDVGEAITVSASYTDDDGTEESVVGNLTGEGVLIEGGPGDDSLVSEAGNDTLESFGGRDILVGQAGDDTLLGGDDLDIAVFQNDILDYSILNTEGTIEISGPLNDGTDTAIDIERFRFTDLSLAFDLDGNAGNVAKLLGVLLGKDDWYVREFVGIGLDLLDNTAISLEALLNLAFETVLGPNPSNTAVISLIYENLVGAPPSEQQSATLSADLLDSGNFTQAELGIFAMDHELNLVNIDIIGLTNFGLEYMELV